MRFEKRYFFYGLAVLTSLFLYDESTQTLSLIERNLQEESASLASLEEVPEGAPLSPVLQKSLGEEVAGEKASLETPPSEKVLVFSTEARKFFEEKILVDPSAKVLFDHVSGIVGNSYAGELIAIYVTTGLFGSNEADFAEYMKVLHESLDHQAEEVFQQLVKNEEALKEDDFTFQMVLNLSGNLSLDTEKKAKLLGMGLTEEFRMKGTDDIEFSAANMTNALILAKHNAIPYEMLRPFLAQGLAATQDPLGKQEFLARIQTYYPDDALSETL